jgi:hypothetical protein
MLEHMPRLDEPFRGSDAVRFGWLTKGELRGPRYRRLFPNVYVSKSPPLDLKTRSRAAQVLLGDGAVLAGYSAAVWLGAACAPHGADAEVTTSGRSARPHPGLRMHRDRLAIDETISASGVLTTTPERTAYDLARWLPLTEAVCAIDALAHTAGFDPKALLSVADRYPRAHGTRRLGAAVALADPRAESVRESLCRLVLVVRGLPAPELQYSVYAGGSFVARLDMAYPDARVGIEYDGVGHRSPSTFTDDLRKGNALVDLGWIILRFTSDDLVRRPDAVAAQVAAMLAKRRGRKGRS